VKVERITNPDMFACGLQIRKSKYHQCSSGFAIPM